MLCPLILGRDDLLELMDHLIDETSHGRGRVLFLSGQAGLGKTRLIRATIRKAEAAGLRVDGGSVAPQDQQVPLASIREMANGMRGNEAFGTLSIDLLAIDGRHEGDPLGSRRLIVRATADRILEAIDRPTLLVFDDLHWTDELSLEVIGELARHGADHPLFLLGAYRADEFQPRTIHREWRSRLLSQRYAEEVRLRALTLEETATATTLILGGELPASHDVVDAVYQRTNGIPLHIEELLAALPDEARADGRRVREAHVPDTIGDAVLARVDRLSSEARTLARAGAVVGRCFTPDLIAGIVDHSLAELEPALEELVDAAILYPFDYVDTGYYDFRHQLLRDAVYSSVPPAQLRRFHARVAEFGMSLTGASIIHASSHFERAGLRPQAFRAATTAAREASRVSARQEACELFRRAIDNMPAELPVLEQAQLFEAFADAASAIEENDEGAVAARRARELYRLAGRPIEAAGMLLSMSTFPFRSGAAHAEIGAFSRQALDEIADLSVTPERERLRAALLSDLANDLFLSSDLEAARIQAVASRDLAESVGDHETVLESDLMLARIQIGAGRTDAGIRDGMRAAREARDRGFESVGVTGYRNVAIMAARVMDYGAAQAAISEGLQYADAIEQSHCRQMMATTSALIDWASGRWDEADSRARQELVDRGCRRGVIGALDVIGLVALGRGRPDEARRWLAESLAAGRTIGEAQLVLTPLWALAESDLLAGDADGAIARCREGLSIALASEERALLIPFVVTGVRSFLAARRPDEAERWVTELRGLLAAWQPTAGAALAHAEGLVRLAAGATVAARSALESAVNGWDARDRVWDATWARLDLAAALLRSTRFAEASRWLSEASATAHALGSGPLLARVAELERQVRGRGADPEPWFPLTIREFEVARLVTAGKTNAQIAEELFVAPKTVSAHVEHILAKLTVSRRSEIAAWAATIVRPDGHERGTDTSATRAEVVVR